MKDNDLPLLAHSTSTPPPLLCFCDEDSASTYDDVTPSDTYSVQAPSGGVTHNWYDEVTTRERINDSLNNVDTKKPKENIHPSFKNCEGAHLTMKCPLEKEDKTVE
ncbi:hypothetical protein Tco_0156424 [Tanacetum coccineum]